MTITTEKELSIQYRLLRTTIKSFRPHLVTPSGKHLPAGSPRLTKAPKSKSGVQIVERQEFDVWLYDFKPSGYLEDNRYNKHIYYFAGGAYQSPPSGGHWGTCARLAKDLIQSGQTLTLVSYPVAPNTPAIKSLPILRDWLRSTMYKAAEQHHTVQLMGDSAGGNIVLSLTFWWAKEAQSSSIVINSPITQDLNVPRSPLTDVVVISPATDLRHDNPEMEKVQEMDPLMTIKSTTECGNLWAEGMDTSDPYISAVLTEPGTFALLRELGVKIHGVIGTYDVLAPDALVFQKLCVDMEIKGHWLIWEGQMHCFPLTGTYGIMEGKKALDWIVKVLKSSEHENAHGFAAPIVVAGEEK